MGWPDDRDLPIEVEASFGADLTADPGAWSWTDLSSRLRNTPITIRVPDAPFSPGTCSVTLLNDDGALSPLHPMSAYWPNVELGTPLRVRLRHTEDAFGRTVSNGRGTADSGQVWSVANGPASAFSVSGGVARDSHTAVNTLRRIVLPTSLLDTEQVIDVATSALLTGAALVTGLVFRYSNGGSDYYWLRCEFNSGGTSVMLKIAKCVGGTFTDLASLNPVPGVPYAANTYLRVRASVVGSRLSMKVWNPAGAEPSGWQVTATDSSITVPGGTGTQSWLVLGNTNTLPVTALHKAYAVRVDRFGGFADQWDPTYIPITTGESASAVRITCSGILRRLGQGTPPSRSPLRRTIDGSGPVAYWPGEDGQLASLAGAATPGVAALAATGVVEFKSLEDYTTFSGSTIRFGTTALPDLSGGGSLAAVLPAAATVATGGGAWTVHAVARVDAPSLSADMVVLEWATPGGTYDRWQLKVTTTSHTQVIGYAAGVATTLIDFGSASASFDHYAVSASVSGGTVTVTLQQGFNPGTPTTSFAGSLGGVQSVAVNPTGTTSSAEMPAGHIAVWAAPLLPFARAAFLDGYGDVVQAARQSWKSEAATDRLARLCAEDGISLSMPPVSADSVQRMGWQPVGTPMDLYRQCIDVDMGLLYELGFGLGYIPREYRYNKPVDMTVDLATYAVSGRGGDVLSPTYDDRDIRNEITVERTEGSSFVAADRDSQQRHGVYEDKVELNLASDEQLADQALWRLHVAGGQPS